MKWSVTFLAASPILFSKTTTGLSCFPSAIVSVLKAMSKNKI
jgi:hypothetical protein